MVFLGYKSGFQIRYADRPNLDASFGVGEVLYDAMSTNVTSPFMAAACQKHLYDSEVGIIHHVVLP